MDKSGTIDYIEFITATMHRHRLEKEEHLLEAFKYFDKDRSGFVFFFVFFLILSQKYIKDEIIFLTQSFIFFFFLNKIHHKGRA